MSWQAPHVIALQRAPERAALAALAAMISITRQSLLASHDALGEERPPIDPNVALAEAILVQLDALDATVAGYLRLEEAEHNARLGEPSF